MIRLLLALLLALGAAVPAAAQGANVIEGADRAIWQGNVRSAPFVSPALVARHLELFE